MLSPEEINDLANLVRLHLSAEEKIAYAQQLTLILNYVEKLNELDTEGVEPLAHILPLYNVLRPDEAFPASNQEEILANAPLLEDGQYKVPRII